MRLDSYREEREERREEGEKGSVQRGRRGRRRMLLLCCYCILLIHSMSCCTLMRLFERSDFLSQGMRRRLAARLPLLLALPHLLCPVLPGCVQLLLLVADDGQHLVCR